jgi:hypothetical protein
MVLPVSLAGTVTTAAIWLKSAVFETSKKYVTSLVPAIAPFTIKKSGLLVFSRPAGATALGASIRAGCPTAVDSVSAATSVLTVDDGAAGLALLAASQPATQITATRAASPRRG